MATTNIDRDDPDVGHHTYETLRNNPIETDTRYAIGSADYFGVVSPVGVYGVEFDLAQAQDEEFVEYLFITGDEERLYQTVEMDLGDSIIETIVDDLQDRTTVIGLIMPDYLLGSAIGLFDDLELFRE
jgi:hypothetical protein